jgi:hypothetical protein
MSREVSACKACGAAIVWAVTSNGRRMPVDADPIPGPNVRLNADGTCDVFGLLHHSHFATCPNADRFRKAKPSDRA